MVEFKGFDIDVSEEDVIDAFESTKEDKSSIKPSGKWDRGIVHDSNWKPSKQVMRSLIRNDHNSLPNEVVEIVENNNFTTNDAEKFFNQLGFLMLHRDYREILEKYAAFYNSKEFDEEKWKFNFKDYFENQIKAELNLTNLTSEDLEKFIQKIEAFDNTDKNIYNVIAQLIGRRPGRESWEVFKEYSLSNSEIAAETISNLFDESIDIQERLNEFESVFRPSIDGEEHTSIGSLQKLATAFLMFAYPEDHIYFKYTEMDEFFEGNLLLHEEIKTGYRPDQYEKVRDSCEIIKDDLQDFIPEASMLNVQDLVWFAAKKQGSSDSGKKYWVEKTERNRDDRQVEGREFGKTLWAPQTDSAGNEISHYTFLKELNPGDVIIHYDQGEGEFVGASNVKQEYEEVPVLEGTDWDYAGVEKMGYDSGERPGYLVELEDYRDFDESISFNSVFNQSRREILDKIRENHNVVYNTKLGVNQGSYLTEAPEPIVKIIQQEYEKANGDSAPHIDVEPEQFNSKQSSIGDILDAHGLESITVEKPKGLYFEDWPELKAQIESALRSGKNIIFTGPPGTGKTKLAQHVAESAENFPGFEEHLFTTATAEWTAFDTIGGYMPRNDDSSRDTHKEVSELSFSEGQFLRCFRNKDGVTNQWLVIDEINRANIDKAFGQLFSVLSKDSTELSYTQNGNPVRIEWVEDKERLSSIDPKEHVYPVTPNWRLLATMNTYDKTSLYEMSYAFMRRFSFIHVGIPQMEDQEDAENQLEKYASQWSQETEDAITEYESELANLWININKHRDIGPALMEDIASFLAKYDSRRNSQEALSHAVVSYVFPQLEGMRKNQLKQLIQEFDKDNFDRGILERKAEDFFEISFESD